MHTTDSVQTESQHKMHSLIKISVFALPTCIHEACPCYCYRNIHSYRKFPKYSDTQKICCNHSKIWTMWLYHRVMSPNNADRMANSVDPDQTAPLGAVWSASALFAQTCLSENLGLLRYVRIVKLLNISCKIRLIIIIKIDCISRGWPI